MKKLNILFVLSMALAFAMTSCSKKDSISPKDREAVIYVAGASYDNGKDIPTYWKIGESVFAGQQSDDISDSDPDVAKKIDSVHLTNGVSGEALAIAVANGSVYVAGYVNGPTRVENIFGNEVEVTTKIAVLWKDGKQITLSNGVYDDEEAVALAVSNRDVYVVGNLNKKQSNNVAFYWKNGNKVNLSDGSNDAFASAIDIAGGDVYVAGEVFNSNANGFPCYWKNGTRVNLTDKGVDSYVNAIYVANKDVYTAGRVNNGAGYVATYWKNKEEVGFGTDAEADGIAVDDNGNVHIAGKTPVYSSPNNPPSAQYYENGKAVWQIRDADARAIAINKGNIYLVGQGKEYNFMGWCSGNGKILSIHSAYTANDVFISGE